MGTFTFLIHLNTFKFRKSKQDLDAQNGFYIMNSSGYLLYSPVYTLK